jgi:hypothetical protein
LCPNGHELIAVKGNYNTHHFRHKHSSDVTPSTLSEWHAGWQSYFPNTEVPFSLIEGQHKPRRADIVTGPFVLEIQHSPITQEEVEQRNHDYTLHEKIVMWIIDGEGLTVQHDVIRFSKMWLFDSFKHAFIDIDGIMYSFQSVDVKSCTVHVSPGIPKPIFIQSLKEGQNIFHVPCPQNKLYIKQQGAGNGKTWGIIQIIARPEFSHVQQFIYLTKQHSAKYMIHREFEAQKSSLGITIIESKEVAKKYIITFTDSDGRVRRIIICTIDSFIYSVGNKTPNTPDLFEGMVASIYKTTIMNTTIEKNGKIMFANQPKLNALTLVIIDETQDLPEQYAEAWWAIQKHTNIDIYVVGDKLQSLTYERNAFTKFMTKKDAILEEPVNCCRRFIHPQLVGLVNHMIPFEDFGLLPITPYKECTDTEDALILFPLIKKDVEACVISFMKHFKKEVCENHRCPEDFLIVTPWVSCSASTELINHIDLAIQDFWVNQLQNEDFKAQLNDFWREHSVDTFHNYSVLHRSEEGTSINLEDSARATRIVSIHSAKGDGRNVVFMVDPSLFKLTCYHDKNSLTFYSAVHVALTRMKQKLYVMYDNDEIGAKIKNFASKHNCPFTTDKINVSKKTRYEDVKGLSALNQLHDTQKEAVFAPEDSRIVEQSHHNIRFMIMSMKTMEILNFGDNRHQISKVLGYCLSGNRTCIKWPSWTQYNSDLKRNNDSNTPNKNIPLLELPTRDCRKFVHIIYETIQRITFNFNAQKSFCPFELIVKYYMIQVIDYGQKTRITMNELYKIVEIYSKSFQHDMKGHENCRCTELFPNNDHTDSLTDYLCRHYEEIEKYERLVQNMKDTYLITDWNINHRVFCKGKKGHFEICSLFSFIGYNETTVLLVYIKPHLNSLNFNDTRLQALMDTYIVSHCSGNNVEKYKGKQIVCCVLTLNQDAPYIIQLLDVPNMNTYIVSLLKEKYERKTKEIQAFYKYWMAEKKCIHAMVQEYHHQNEKDDFAPYITSIMNDIDSRYTNCEEGADELTPGEFVTKLSSDGKGSFIHLLQIKLERYLKEDFE